jgi:hypothetical protein
VNDGAAHALARFDTLDGHGILLSGEMGWLSA